MARTTAPKSAKKTSKTTPTRKTSKTKQGARSTKPKGNVRVTKVGGDQQNISNVSGQAIAIQGRNTVTITQGIQATELKSLFDSVYARIETLPEARPEEKQEIKENVQRIETEVAKQKEPVNESSLQRWMNNIQAMAPDIVDVILSGLSGGPVTVATTVLKKIAGRAKQPAQA